MVYELLTLKCWPAVKRNESRLFKGCQYLFKSDLIYVYDIISDIFFPNETVQIISNVQVIYFFCWIVPTFSYFYFISVLSYTKLHKNKLRISFIQLSYQKIITLKWVSSEIPNIFWLELGFGLCWSTGFLLDENTSRWKPLKLRRSFAIADRAAIWCA